MVVGSCSGCGGKSGCGYGSGCGEECCGCCGIGEEFGGCSLGSGRINGNLCVGDIVRGFICRRLWDMVVRIVCMR